MAFLVVFLFAVLFLSLAAFASYKPKTSLSLQLLALATLIIGPIFAYFAVEKIYKPVEIQELTIQHLYFQDLAVLRGVFINRSSQMLEGCIIKAKGYEYPTNSLDYIGKIVKPLSKGKVVVESQITPQSGYRFEIELPKITPDQNITVSISARCR